MYISYISLICYINTYESLKESGFCTLFIMFDYHMQSFLSLICIYTGFSHNLSYQYMFYTLILLSIHVLYTVFAINVPFYTLFLLLNRFRFVIYQHSVHYYL